MEVILLESIEGLGARGKRVNVAQGYARNYLIPRRLAVVATEAGEAVFKEEVRIRGRREQKHNAAAEQIRATLDGLEVHIRAQASEEGKLYGSVTAAEIVAGLAEMGRDIDRKAVVLDEPIKHIGVYPTRIRLAPTVSAEVKVWVERSE